MATDSTALLLAVERGDGAEVERLARALAELLARLAVDVLAGGPLMVAKAIELADILAPDVIDGPARSAKGAQ